MLVTILLLHPRKPLFEGEHIDLLLNLQLS